MDYYEELGVPRAAPVEDIRRAWRNLARLLHPDQQQDEGLRLLAERQMKRLNEVCAVLTDPVQRMRYDQSLPGAPHPAPPARRWMDAGRRWGLAAALAVCAIAAAILTPRSAAPRTTPNRSAGPSAPPAAYTPKPVRKRAGRTSQIVRRSPDPRNDTPLHVPVEPSPPEIAGNTFDTSQPIVVPSIAVPTPPSPAEPEAGIAGAWFFAPAKSSSGSPALYPPEFIEMFITGTADALHGRYRARYKVGDRPISGDVRFTFEGQGTGDPLVLSWTGSEGASGEIRLKPLPDGTLQVTWQATQLGGSMGLASGTAVLTRRREL